jgi:ferric-dicitrate binding protein FerR (iron transport regulator)
VRLHSPVSADLLVSRVSAEVLSGDAGFQQWIRAALPVRSLRLAVGGSVRISRSHSAIGKALTPELIEHKLAWKDGWLRFSDETIPEAVERFNDYNCAKKLNDARTETRPMPAEKSTATCLSSGCKVSLLRCDTPLGQ